MSPRREKIEDAVTHVGILLFVIAGFTVAALFVSAWMDTLSNAAGHGVWK